MLNVTSGAAAPMGTTGDGTSTQFQLARSIGGVAWDGDQNLNGKHPCPSQRLCGCSGTDFEHWCGYIHFSASKRRNTSVVGELLLSVQVR